MNGAIIALLSQIEIQWNWTFREDAGFFHWDVKTLGPLLKNYIASLNKYVVYLGLIKLHEIPGI